MSCDVLSELKEQVQHLMRVVEELATLKHDLKDGVAGIRATTPLIPDDFSDGCFGNIVGDAIRSLYEPGESSNEVIQESPTPDSSHTLPALQQPLPFSVPCPAVIQSPAAAFASPPIMSRAPLRSIEPNLQPISPFSGPTEMQRLKVEGIVRLGREITTCALACIDVLFSEEELANGNIGGVRGFQPLDCNKMNLLKSVLCQKFNSPNFYEQWEQLKSKINTKCRGKRRTLVQRLKKDFR
ncbi:hypothetical protein OS493_033189 [Desmophyllum pertusum]|uniref:BEN domain-containing protein n=1 Tax=Desmophyllum pertusum TaxID=174260 RepID=A0A9X0CE38_9CNID|nr:hypothetical protein OS493_033189 [Desmophyllum pertusum]